MLAYMLDTNICIHVMKNYPQDLREKFNSLAEQLCISSITLGELHFGAEKSARRADNLTAVEHFVARLDVLSFDPKAAAHYGQLRAELERAGTPCGPHDMQIGGHARSQGLIVVTNNAREFRRMEGNQVENWVEKTQSSSGRSSFLILRALIFLRYSVLQPWSHVPSNANVAEIIEHTAWQKMTITIKKLARWMLGVQQVEKFHSCRPIPLLQRESTKQQQCTVRIRMPYLLEDIHRIRDREMRAYQDNRGGRYWRWQPDYPIGGHADENIILDRRCGC